MAGKIKEYNRSISVDCVIFGFSVKEMHVLLIERKQKNPETGKTEWLDLKFPGSLVPDTDDLDTAAAGVLKELTGLDNVYLRQFHTFGNPNRIGKPEERAWIEETYGVQVARIVTVAYYSLINIDDNPIPLKDEAKWHNLGLIKNLAFDHMEILKEGQNALRQELKTEPRVAFALLPEKFTIRQLQTVYETILDLQLDNRNFRKKLSTAHYITPLSERQEGVRHKPAQYFTFDETLFLKERKEQMSFFF